MTVCMLLMTMVNQWIFYNILKRTYSCKHLVLLYLPILYISFSVIKDELVK